MGCRWGSCRRRGARPSSTEDDVPEPPVFEVGENVRVLPVTYPGFLPRHATGCNGGTVIDFDFATREHTAKPLAMFSRAWTKTPEKKQPPVTAV